MTNPDASRPMVVVTGSYPPDICGVGDYTHRLLEVAPEDWVLFTTKNWSLRRLPQIVRDLLAKRPSTVLVQYPTQGYGWSLVPHLLLMYGKLSGRYRTALALHEFGSLSRKSRIALTLLSRFLDVLIFTTDKEQHKALSSLGFREAATIKTIPILSNIPFQLSTAATSKRVVDLVYFGHIRPNKGLEQFVEVARTLLTQIPDLAIMIIGVVPTGFEDFADDMEGRLKGTNCEILIGLEPDGVAAKLREARVAYLPYPDGISARRGTALAAMGNGVVVAAPFGPDTPDEMRAAIVECYGDARDVNIVRETLGSPEARLRQRQQAGQAYLREALPNGWPEIARLYDEALKAHSTRQMRDDRSSSDA